MTSLPDDFDYIAADHLDDPHTCTNQWNPRCWCESDVDYTRRTMTK